MALKNVTLKWHGSHSPDSKLLDAEGRNLFDEFPVTGIEVKWPGEDRFDRREELTLSVRIGENFNIEGATARVRVEDLRRLADAHGFDLVARPPIGAAKPGGA